MAEASAPQKIVVLEDDPAVARIINRATGLPTENATTITELETVLNTVEPMALFFDVHLGMNSSGLEYIPLFKQRLPFCPLIVVTGDHSPELVGDALAAGADDFIYKPLNVKEIAARLQVRLSELSVRRNIEVVNLGDVSIDFVHRVIANQNRVKRFLSPTEMSMLHCLISAQGTVVRREIIKRKCWGELHVSDNALNRKLHEVRKALQEISNHVSVETVYGTGFSLRVK
jgi:DNA-binding response OmpR family regulator